MMEWLSSVVQRVQSGARHAYEKISGAPAEQAEPRPRTIENYSPQELSAGLLRAAAVDHDANRDRFTSAAESARSEIGALAGKLMVGALRLQEPPRVQFYSMRVLPADAADRAAGMELPNRPTIERNSFVVPDQLLAPAATLRGAPALEGGGLVGWLRNLFPHRMEAVHLSDVCAANPELQCTPLPKGNVLIHQGPGQRT
jgi:hypothetical protein